MRHRTGSMLAIVAVLLASAGCASIIAPGPEVVPVSSDPTGAHVFLDGYEVGRAPMNVTLTRKCDGLLRFELPGYRSRTVDIDKEINTAFIGNLGLLWFYPVGMVVDLIASNQGKYPTTPVNVELVPEAR